MNEAARPNAVVVAGPSTPHGLPAKLVRWAGFVVVGVLLLQYGFPLDDRLRQWLNGISVALALWFGADLLMAALMPGRWRATLTLRRFEFLLLFLLIAVLALLWGIEASARDPVLEMLHLRSAGTAAFHAVELFLLSVVGIQILRGIQRLLVKSTRPELILASSFGALIGIGTLLLLLPNSSAKLEAPIGLMDAFFTATSAACVTGLGVRDTGADFSTFGQMVIMALFQVGGLGIITFVAFLSVFSAKTLPVTQMVVFRQLVNAPALSDLKRQIAGIFLATITIETVGAVLLFNALTGEEDLIARLKWSVFHSVSAFCNAGFALHSTSLEAYRASWSVNLPIMGLIILGGLGFLVIPEILKYRVTRTPFFRRFRWFHRLHSGHAPSRLSVQTKLALTATIALLVVGFAMFWILEGRHMLVGKTFAESALTSAFQSVTARTAGFNTVPIAELQDATLVFMMMLMVIGANPVSAGGGIKTVSFAILLLALRAMILQRERVEAFGRTLPTRTLFAALSVFVLYVMSAALGIFALSFFDPHMSLRDQAFEVISALSTVGLSTGITAELSGPSKVVLCLAMFIGRVGPISLVLSVFQGRRTLTYEFPEEEVIVG